MTPCPRNTDASAPPKCGKAKCTVSRSWPLPRRRRGASGCPAQHGDQPGTCPAARPERAPGSVQLAPGSGPVCREVRLSFGSMWCREGRGQIKCTRTEAGGRGYGGAWGQVLENAALAGLEPPCPNRGLTKAGEGNREGAGG